MIFAPFNGKLYAQYYEDSGVFVGVRKDTTPITTILKNGNGWQDFIDWNVIQQEPLLLDDIDPPDPPATPFLDYASAFINNRLLWVKLHKSLDDDRSAFDISTATGATILAKLREQVKGVRDVIATAPQGVIDEFHRERVLQGSTTANPLNDAAIDAMTAAECRICISVARLAANQGLAIVTAAYSLNE